MNPQNQVTVRSSETGNTFSVNRRVAERHSTLTILDATEAAEVESEGHYSALDYHDLRAEVARREHLSPTSFKAADLIAALVADDKEI